MRIEHVESLHLFVTNILFMLSSGEIKDTKIQKIQIEHVKSVD